MITRQEEPRRRNVFEIAIAVSIALHLLFGGVFFPLAHLMKIPEPRPTEQPLVALSDVVTIEKRTVPRPHPLAQPRPVTPQKPPVILTQKTPEIPKPPTPLEEPKKRDVPPVKRTEHKELAATRPSHVSVADNGAPREGTTKGTRGKSMIALAPLQPKTPSTKPGQLTEEQLAALERQFAQTIAQARAQSNPLDVPTEPPAGQKRYQLQMKGIYSYLKAGEGEITPTRHWTQGDYNYYYMNYEIEYSDGTFEQGSIPWPSRWPTNVIADIERPGWHGPMPCPAPGYTLPTLQEYWSFKLAVRDGLHNCFPDKYPPPE
jgi:hypothetical protein